MSLEVDYYRVLGVDELSTPEEVRSAFRRAAKVYHPDQNPGDPYAAPRFKQIKEAYEVLSDPARRAEYRRPPPAPPPHWEEAYAGTRESATLTPTRDRSAAGEVGHALGLVTAAATIRLGRGLKDLLQYLERL